ncbi:MAG: hypothetical protein P4M07_12605 [Xanthobacteraceae bacterium]|nr:hypothetical protein [Xanthobacteraceae bacterium]
MLFFIIFLPSLTLATLSWLVPASASLFAAAAVTGLLVLRDAVAGRSLKLLNLTMLALFGGLGVALLLSPALSAIGVRIAIDAGLLIAVLIALALRFPFTLQYAREEAAPDAAAMPAFIRTNYVLSLAWIGAFALMLVADIVALRWPVLPLWTALAVAFVARNAAVGFTRWYVRRARGRAAGAT